MPVSHCKRRKKCYYNTWTSWRLLVNQERTAHFEGFPAHAIDTTAAGDSFNGAIATYLSQGKTIDEAITFGNKVASITVTRVGAQSSIPSLEEVLNH